jgi:hypothetical protein
MRGQSVHGSIGLGGAMKDNASTTEEPRKKLDALIEYVEDLISLPKVADDAVVRVQLEETLESLKKTREKVEDGPSIQ